MATALDTVDDGLAVCSSRRSGALRVRLGCCYKFVTVSIAENIKSEDRDLAEHVRQEATTREFCGDTQYSALLTLESLAERGVVTQVGFQWLEPKGWSFTDREMLDVVDALGIQAPEIRGRVSGYVH